MKIFQLSIISVITFLIVIGAYSEKFDHQTSNPTELPSSINTPTIAATSVGDSGYMNAFEQELQNIGQISTQEFGQRYASEAEYLPQITWSPETAEFWDEFNTDPEVHNQTLEPQNQRSYDFRLNPEELSAFTQNGFVVSERLGAQSFAEMFYRIYTNDLPVFVSTDSILHAWHLSYDKALQELEITYLAPSLAQLLENMAAEIPSLWEQHSDSALASGIVDADYFLAVARSLLSGNLVKPYLSQETRVTETLTAIKHQQAQTFNLFGRDRIIDFSQFKVRGHYEESELLRRYFQAMMWCGRIDFRVADDSGESSARELGGAVILLELLKQSGQFEQWRQFDKLLQTFVGKADYITFEQLDRFLTQADITSLAEVSSLAALENLQVNILNSNIGSQEINSHIYVASGEASPTNPPKSFALLGQRFSLDSWAISKVVYDQIQWNKHKVERHLPSALDVAFSVFGNNQVVPNIISRILGDGFNYQHNLAAIRNVIDHQADTAWEENIYTNWLATLRTLSQDTTDPKYPEAMRTNAWAMKTVNSQLASWTQLRHDTILYNKQSYGGMLCFYPAGFVEPRPEFWARFEKMVSMTADLLENTPFLGEEESIDPEVQQMLLDHYQHRQEERIAFFKQFAEVLERLKEISIKELSQEPLTDEEIQFLKDIVELEKDYVGQIQYGGWYPRLFYGGPEDSTGWDAIVADVHTNPNGGVILHEGVGNVDMLMIAVDSGEDKMVYVGPVLSHYEFEVSGFSRLADSEWSERIKRGNAPPRPDWTQEYLVPGRNPDARSYPRPASQWVRDSIGYEVPVPPPFPLPND